jgi:hypothetical protein
MPSASAIQRRLGPLALGDVLHDRKNILPAIARI